MEKILFFTNVVIIISLCSLWLSREKEMIG